jgi:hypothetical protein
MVAVDMDRARGMLLPGDNTANINVVRCARPVWYFGERSPRKLPRLFAHLPATAALLQYSLQRS